MHVVRRFGAAAVIAALVGMLLVPATVEAKGRGWWPRVFSYSAPCVSFPGVIHLRTSRIDEETSRVTMRAVGIPDQRWRGSISRYFRGRAVEEVRFDVRPEDGRASASGTLVTKPGTSLITVSLRATRGDRWCKVGGQIHNGQIVQLTGRMSANVAVFPDDLTISASVRDCGPRRIGWTGRATITDPRHTYRRSLGRDDCHGSRVEFDTGPIAGVTKLPESVKVVARDRAGRVLRTSYSMSF